MKSAVQAVETGSVVPPVKESVLKTKNPCGGRFYYLPHTAQKHPGTADIEW